MEPIDDTLKDRGTKYGKFNKHAELTQRLKTIMRSAPGWHNNLTDSQRECLEMVQHKIGRILNGDPKYIDSWVDIIGYTKLVIDELENAKAVP